MTAVEVVGWAGALALLIAYGLLTAGRLQATDRTCVGLNLAGSAGLALNGAAHTAWPSMALNLLWLAIALHGLHAARRCTSPSPDACPTGRSSSGTVA